MKTLTMTELTKLERAAWHALQKFSEVAKANPDCSILKDHTKQASDRWVHYRNLVLANQRARAEREEVIWTQFNPQDGFVRELVRTPHYTLTRRLWKNWSPSAYQPDRQPKQSDVYRHFRAINQPTTV